MMLSKGHMCVRTDRVEALHEDGRIEAAAFASSHPRALQQISIVVAAIGDCKQSIAPILPTGEVSCMQFAGHYE